MNWNESGALLTGFVVGLIRFDFGSEGEAGRRFLDHFLALLRAVGAGRRRHFVFGLFGPAAQRRRR